MSLKYHLVQRPDKRKGATEGSKLYYGQVRAQGTIDFNRLCETIAAYSTASKGDVMLVIDGLLFVLKQSLADGNIVQMGEFGNFRMSAGSSGVETEKEFSTSLFKKGRIIFTPGSMLKEITTKNKFEKLDVITKTETETEDDGPIEVT